MCLQFLPFCVTLIKYMTTINAEVDKKPNENAMSLIRRFRHRMQSSGVLIKSRKIRFHIRPLSKMGKKVQTLKHLKKKKEMEYLRKLGKIPS